MISEKNDTSFYKKIAQDIESRIRGNRLPAGSKVPSVRKLAKYYGASVCTVYNALDELKYKGIVEAKAGSGYFVSYDGWNTLFPDTPDWDKFLKLSWLQERTNESCFFHRASALSLSGFSVGNHFGANKYLKKAMAKCLDDNSSFSNNENEPLGLLSLREALSDDMQRHGVVAGADEILITSGVFNSLSLIRLGLMRSGMDFICENFFTAKANSTYSSLGINKIILPVDNDGLILDKLTQALQKNKQAVVCSTFGGLAPYSDDKTFGVTTIQRKRAILKLCNASRTPIIEVDLYRDLLPLNSPQPLKSMDTVHSVLYIGSFTKSFMRKFRVGWVIGPKEVIQKLANLKMELEGGQNFVIQEIAEKLISSGLYREYLENLHRQLKEMTPKIISIFEKHLKGIATWNTNSLTRGAYLRFIDEIDMHKMYENRGDLQFSPGYMLDNEWEQYVSVSVVSLPLDEFDSAIEQLSILAKKSFR